MQTRPVSSTKIADLEILASFDRHVSGEKRTAALLGTNLVAMVIFSIGAIANAMADRWLWLEQAIENPLIPILALVTGLVILATVGRSFWSSHQRLTRSERDLLESELLLARIRDSSDSHSIE